MTGTPPHRLAFWASHNADAIVTVDCSENVASINPAGPNPAHLDLLLSYFEHAQEWKSCDSLPQHGTEFVAIAGWLCCLLQQPVTRLACCTLHGHHTE